MSMAKRHAEILKKPVALDAALLKRIAEHGHDDVLELWWGMFPGLGTMPERRKFLDAVYVIFLHRIGQAVKEALEGKDREDEDALRRMQWEGCPHGDEPEDRT